MCEDAIPIGLKAQKILREAEKFGPATRADANEKAHVLGLYLAKLVCEGTRGAVPGRICGPERSFFGGAWEGPRSGGLIVAGLLAFVTIAVATDHTLSAKGAL